ncbi:putative NADH-ubiquinone oxidoreductase kDa subunit [Rosellinia necatrix]|uniref:Putative NADH-ubiquinone oxidoreductase kDa subunit n=1 Tax=Rosellinia necatrix TaxID=77044 RepID=A0A1W2TG34_ROSNE|nr:putative NADH-ubiquinone oxidoreductase kDa subunit [Rosellinia necatrix]
MLKRKRGEPGLEDSIAKWRKELARGMKLAKGFERQRLNKRVHEADAGKAARLEKEILVLKSLDLQQTAHTHLCSSLLRIKRIAESPNLPADIKPVPKPELSEEEKAALHNVTSALYKRKQVTDVIDKAIKGTCIALGVPVPEKGGKSKTNKKAAITKQPKAENGGQVDGGEDPDPDSLGDDESDDAEEPQFEGPLLLKRKVEKTVGEDDLESSLDSDASESSEFRGFPDSDAEEKMFSKYDGLVGGSSDDDESDENDEEGETDNDESDHADNRAKSFQQLALDDISLSSEPSEDSDSSEDETLAPPTKKSKKVQAVKPVSFNTGNSTFLPSLMGGYVSGSESASDVDVAPQRKNRRGQRARQAIWDKKFGEKAVHHQKEKDSRNSGWDMKRGAVEGDGASKPWKKGIQNPFEKNNVHPDRQQQMHGHGGRQDKGRGPRDAQGGRQSRQHDRSIGPQADKPKPRPPPTRDDTGPLHPSWAAAKKSKEGNQKVEFQGKKVTFD